MKKTYAEDRAKIKANAAAAAERHRHNAAVDKAKTDKFYANREVFVPRKAAHPMGWRIAAN